MSHAHCARNVDISQLCASQGKISQRELFLDDSGDSSAFLGAFYDTSSAWTKKTFVAGTPVIMTVDTGADVTAISEEDFSTIRPKPQLDISRRVLRGPDGKRLHVLGAFNAKMSFDSRFDRSSRHTVYVIGGLHTSLLGRPAIQALHVLQRPQVGSPLSFDSLLQEQWNLGLSPTLHWSRGNARNAAPYSLSRQCYTLLAQYATSGTCPAHCQGGCYSRQNGVRRRYPPDRRTNRVVCGHGRRTKIER